MPDLADGESTQLKGSAATPYELKNIGGVYSCSCPAWRNQGVAIERRTCKHLKKLRGEAAELARVGGKAAAPTRSTSAGATDRDGDPDEAASAQAPPLLLAEKWDNVTDLSGWWLSEKLDGVRAYWDGETFTSRLGNRYHAPDWFVAGMPKLALDGELWVGRGAFQQTVSIVRRQDQSAPWKSVRYLVFDAPALDAPFEARLTEIARLVARARMTHVEAVPHTRVASLDALRAELARVEALGGEGLMLRQPGSRYEVGRSSTLLKVKTFHDAEARVVGHVAGAGRHKGRLGALECMREGGARFRVGTGFSDAEREAPPAVGSTITYRYQELSDKGVPRFPSFVRVVRYRG